MKTNVQKAEKFGREIWAELLPKFPVGLIIVRGKLLNAEDTKWEVLKKTIPFKTYLK